MSKLVRVAIITAVALFFAVMPFVYSMLFDQKSQGRFVLEQEIEANFFVSQKPYVLLFFGYVGCENICIPLLDEIKVLYEERMDASMRANFDVVFVNLTSEISHEAPDDFAKFFHPDFIGVHLSDAQIARIERTFALYFSRSMADKSKLDHTDHLYLIQNTPVKRLLNLYTTHPIHHDRLLRDLSESMQNTQGAQRI